MTGGVYEEPEVLTVLETARALFYQGSEEEAVEWYRAHLEDNPQDMGVMREYAVALLGAGRPLNAVAMMGYAYDLSPGLSASAMDAGLWGDSWARLRGAVRDAVRYANRSPSGGAWLLVAVLMQAEGRDNVAARMIDRAAGLGLSSAVADRMRTRLTQ